MPSAAASAVLEDRIHSLGEKLLDAVDEAAASRAGGWLDTLIERAIRDPAFRVQVLRFIDVLLVLRADSFSQAIELANGTRYALTGSVYSRWPAHLAQARKTFEVGNLYLNCKATVALVSPQPFGGFRLNGIGSKARGPDFLRQFVDPVCVTENTTQRGFAPEVKSK